jgi:YVTN family beta-propeller protein/uncharacterized repeat protein (TIGR03803 family)
MTPSGILTTLYSFCSQSGCTDGATPFAGLAQGVDGNFYGTTELGGGSGGTFCGTVGGCGTVFKITPNGMLTTLHTFCSQSNCSDGGIPFTGLVQGVDGNFYGTTEVGGGGQSFCGVVGCGTVFKITPNGMLTTLYRFCSQSGCADGGFPDAALVQGADGNFYGTTEGFGANSEACAQSGSGDCGTVFKITPGGTLTTLYSFCTQTGCADGDSPQAALIQGADGELYGTTLFGGNSSVNCLATAGTGCGTIFKITTGGGLTTLYSFCPQSGCADGAIPFGALVQGSDGNLYGTTGLGGAGNAVCQGGIAGCGTIFKITAGGALTTLHSFCSQTRCTDGGTPFVGLIQGTNGNFYGTTVGGGTAGYGTVFSFSTGVGPANGPFAYVANINSNTVSVINIPTSTVASTIPVGSGPWGVAVSPDQTQVYVSNNHGNNVSVINTASDTVVATIPVQSSPFGVAFTPDGTEAYVVNGSSNSVSVINTASQTVVATVPVQHSPVGVAMALTSNGTFAYVTNSGSNSVSVIAVSSSTVVQTIAVGSGPRWVAIAPNSSLAYVENAGSNTVSVISVATNTVTATIPVGLSPFGAAFTPDSSLAYVVNSASNTVSEIDTATSSVIATVTGFSNPVHVALSTDGSSAYVTNLGANNVSLIATATNTVTGTVGVGSAPIDIAIAAAPPTSQQITQPLSPTMPNVFNFGTNAYQVQYPAGTNFSNIDMTVNAVQLTQAQFQLRVAGTQFANATCIVYSSAGGNCVDDEVTCSQNGSPISCPSEAQPTIAVQTTFTTLQGIVNPGYLTTPIGENDWTNIFSGFSDPTVKGKTSGFSEFVAVSLGANNPQGLAKFQILYPILPKNYSKGQAIPFAIRLTSLATGKPITDAEASIAVVMTADAHGNPTQKTVFSKTDAFAPDFGANGYLFTLQAGNYAAGTYTVTIYGNAFPAHQGQFILQ